MWNKTTPKYLCIVLMSTYMLQLQSWIATIDAVCSTKPKLFTTWPFRKTKQTNFVVFADLKLCWPLSYFMNKERGKKRVNSVIGIWTQSVSHAIPCFLLLLPLVLWPPFGSILELLQFFCPSTHTTHTIDWQPILKSLFWLNFGMSLRNNLHYLSQVPKFFH